MAEAIELTDVERDRDEFTRQFLRREGIDPDNDPLSRSWANNLYDSGIRYDSTFDENDKQDSFLVDEVGNQLLKTSESYQKALITRSMMRFAGEFIGWNEEGVYNIISKLRLPKLSDELLAEAKVGQETWMKKPQYYYNSFNGEVEVILNSGRFVVFAPHNDDSKYNDNKIGGGYRLADLIRKNVIKQIDVIHGDMLAGVAPRVPEPFAEVAVSEVTAYFDDPDSPFHMGESPPPGAEIIAPAEPEPEPALQPVQQPQPQAPDTQPVQQPKPARQPQKPQPQAPDTQPQKQPETKRKKPGQSKKPEEIPMKKIPAKPVPKRKPAQTPKQKHAELETKRAIEYRKRQVKVITDDVESLLSSLDRSNFVFNLALKRWGLKGSLQYVPRSGTRGGRGEANPLKMYVEHRVSEIPKDELTIRELCLRKFPVKKEWDSPKVNNEHTSASYLATRIIIAAGLKGKVISQEYNPTALEPTLERVRITHDGVVAEVDPSGESGKVLIDKNGVITDEFREEVIAAFQGWESLKGVCYKFRMGAQWLIKKVGDTVENLANREAKDAALQAKYGDEIRFAITRPSLINMPFEAQQDKLEEWGERIDNLIKVLEEDNEVPDSWWKLKELRVARRAATEALDKLRGVTTAHREAEERTEAGVRWYRRLWSYMKKRFGIGLSVLGLAATIMSVVTGLLLYFGNRGAKAVGEAADSLAKGADKVAGSLTAFSKTIAPIANAISSFARVVSAMLKFLAANQWIIIAAVEMFLVKKILPMLSNFGIPLRVINALEYQLVIASTVLSVFIAYS